MAGNASRARSFPSAITAWPAIFVVVEQLAEHVHCIGMLGLGQREHQHLPGTPIGTITGKLDEVIKYRVIGNDR